MKPGIHILSGLLLAVLMLAFLAAPALAFETRTSTNITIGQGETIEDDLYLIGTNIIIDGTVNGDVFALGQDIVLNGTINGSLNFAGQTATLNGNISQSARLAGQTLTINGSIGRDLIAAASRLTVNNSAEITRDLAVTATTVFVNGHVAGEMTGDIDNATIGGRVDGDVDLIVDSLVVGSTAVIGGNLEYTSRNTADIQPGAVITGTTTQIPPEEEPGRDRVWFIFPGIIASAVSRVASFLMIFVIGVAIIYGAFRHIQLLARAIQHSPAGSFGWGALLFFVTPIAAVIVMLTIIGFPLGLLSLVIWGILLYLVQLPVALIIGMLILRAHHPVNSHLFLIGCLALGLAILYILSIIPVFGFFMWVLVCIFGLGSLIAVFRSRTALRS